MVYQSGIQFYENRSDCRSNFSNYYRTTNFFVNCLKTYLCGLQLWRAFHLGKSNSWDQ